MGDDHSNISNPDEATATEENREYEEIKRRAKEMTFRARELGGAALEKTNPLGWQNGFCLSMNLLAFS